MAHLVADHVTKVYEPTGRGQTAVNAISDFGFEASGHTFVCLVGPSGCGRARSSIWCPALRSRHRARSR
jgi:NitT/TauT family transport system ATP-binding protein